MHNTTKQNAGQNISTGNFPNNSSNHSKSIATTTNNTERSQKFSFSSTYTASHFNFAGSKFNTLPTNSLPFNPVSAFTIVHDDSSFTGKPNAIVRPIRRPEQQQTLSRPVCQNDANSMGIQHQRQQASCSSITHQSQSGQDVHNFMAELKRKLHFLNDKDNAGAWPKSRSSTQHASNQETLGKRPLFITTVPTGVFLPPPKEPPLLPPFFRRRVYAFSSHPVIFNTDYYHHNDTYNSNKSALSKDKAVACDDNRSTTNASHMNGVQECSPAVSLVGGVHLTKHQFQQHIRQHRAKRETPIEPYKNVMYDRRVVRGSNFGATPLLDESDPFDKAAELRRRHALRKKTICRNQRNVLGTPPPVAGRRHEVIQTEKYLEELVERPPEFSVDTQTDLFLERPPIPPYVPAKVGVDVSTEIGEGELFHFDAEAQPIIDILVDACIEQSMLEVAHQQEIEALRKKQEEFMAQREAELAELRRLESEEIRLQAEKERRLRQDAIAKELDEEMQKGVTAAKLLQGHIAGLLPEVLENLEPATDAAKKEQLMKTICPWLTVEVAEEVGQIVDSREILTVIIQEIIKQRAEVYAGYKEETPSMQLKKAIVCEDEEEGACDQIPECCYCETGSSDDCTPQV